MVAIAMKTRAQMGGGGVATSRTWARSPKADRQHTKGTTASLCRSVNVILDLFQGQLCDSALGFKKD